MVTIDNSLKCYHGNNRLFTEMRHECYEGNNNRHFSEMGHKYYHGNNNRPFTEMRQMLPW